MPVEEFRSFCNHSLGVLNNEKSQPFSFVRTAVVVMIENDLEYVVFFIFSMNFKICVY